MASGLVEHTGSAFVEQALVVQMRTWPDPQVSGSGVLLIGEQHTRKHPCPRTRRWSANPDGSDPVLRVEDASYHSSYSPDGRSIAYQKLVPVPGSERYTSGGGPTFLDQIFIANADGSRPRQVTHTTLEEFREQDRRGFGAPLWRPDGQEIAVLTQGVPTQGATTSHITFLVVATQARRVVDLPRDLRTTDIAWTSTEQLVFVGFSHRDDGEARERAEHDPARGLYVIGRDGKGLRRISDQEFYGLATSPDGQQIAASDLDGEITILDLDGQIVRRAVVNDPDVYAWGEFAWSPDGARLAFTGGYDVPGVFGGHEDIFTIGVDGSGLTQVTSVGDAWAPAWQPVRE